MELKKGDRVFHKGLELVGTFMEYAWNSDEEAIVKFDNRSIKKGTVERDVI